MSSTVATSNSIATNPVLQSLSINNQTAAQNAAGSNTQINENQFLQMMIAQMKNQDPTSPQDNSQMVSQLAQFSSLSALNNLNTSFANFSSSFSSNQALQASSLVGRSVTVAGSMAQYLQNSIVSGIVNLPQATSDASMMIYNADNGALVQKIDLGSQSAGNLNFRWDGENFELNGNIVPSTQAVQSLPPNGNYKFIAQALANGQPQQLSTALSANVNSVTVDPSNGIILNLAGSGSVNLSSVKAFN